MFDINADIIANTGLGNINLGENISKYEGYFQNLELHGKLHYEQVEIFSTRYKFSEYPIEINVNTRTGIIYKISALPGYKGSFREIYHVGMKSSTLLYSSEFYYDDCDEATFSNIEKGILFEFDIEDPLPDEIYNLKVDSITVFLESLFKPTRKSE